MEEDQQICRGCFQIRLELERYIIELHNREQALAELQGKNDTLRHKNAQDKRRHIEINNEIIMSNVRYQQALTKAQSTVDRYSQEREATAKVIAIKDIENAELRAQNEMLKALYNQRPQPSPVSDSTKTHLPPVKEERPEKPHASPAPQKDNRSPAREQPIKKETTSRRPRYALRGDVRVDYTEPSLKKKLRQGYTDRFIIADDDTARSKKTNLPLHDDKENVPPQHGTPTQ